MSVGFQIKEKKRSRDTSIGGEKPRTEREERLGQAVVRRRLSWESIQTQDKVRKKKCFASILMEEAKFKTKRKINMWGRELARETVTCQHTP